MKINDLTIGQAKDIAKMFCEKDIMAISGLNSLIGKKVIVRTYSAGVHFGTLTAKSGNEVYLENSRRLWKWHTKESITLSSISIHGIDKELSNISETIDIIWLEAIEIIPCTLEAIESIESQKNAEAI